MMIYSDMNDKFFPHIFFTPLRRVRVMLEGVCEWLRGIERRFEKRVEQEPVFDPRVWAEPNFSEFETLTNLLEDAPWR